MSVIYTVTDFFVKNVNFNFFQIFFQIYGKMPKFASQCK